MVYTCNSCERNFTTHRGLNIHRASCKVSTPEIIHNRNGDISLNVDFQQVNVIETNRIVEAEVLLIECEKNNFTKSSII